jgi:hypothetical protein
MLRIGLWCIVGGFAAIFLGLIAAGGFGPCGPQHLGPFLLALAGLATFGAGVVTLTVGLLLAALRR